MDSADFEDLWKVSSSLKRSFGEGDHPQDGGGVASAWVLGMGEHPSVIASRCHLPKAGASGRKESSLLIPVDRHTHLTVTRRPAAVHARRVEAVAGLAPGGGVDDAAVAAKFAEFGDHVIGDLLDFLV